MENNNISIYDLLNRDVEFARQIAELHRCAAATLKASETVAAAAETQLSVKDELVRRSAELSDMISRGEGLLMDLRRERESLQEDIRRHESILEEMQRLEESFNGAMTAYGNISGVYRIFEDRLKEMESRPVAAPAEAPSREPIRTAPEPAAQSAARKTPFEPVPGVDYDEITSVEKLFRKYNGRLPGPVVVVRRKTFPWNGDYCMAIRKIGGGKAWGMRYSYGQPGKKSPVNATEEEYSLYAGDYYAAVAEDFAKQR